MGDLIIVMILVTKLQLGNALVRQAPAWHSSDSKLELAMPLHYAAGAA